MGEPWRAYCRPTHLGARLTHLGARLSLSELVFPHKRALLDRNTPQFHQLSGWLVLEEVKKLNVEALGWRGYTWFAVVTAGWMYCQIL